MPTSRKKYYVVWRGHTPGIYERWSACQEQIKGYPGAQYKSFEQLEEARQALQAGPPRFAAGAKKTSIKKEAHFQPNSICVDAACSGNPGPMEYQGVYTRSKEQLFHKKFPLGTNNIGEFLGIVHALAYLKQRGEHQLPVYSDSVIAIKWVKQKKCKTQLEDNARTRELLQLVQRAEDWLNNNAYANPILKWETEDWGEIPADFGRK